MGHIEEMERQEKILNWMTSLPYGGKCLNEAIDLVKTENQLGRSFQRTSTVEEAKASLIDFLEETGMNLQEFENEFERIQNEAIKRRNA